MGIFTERECPSIDERPVFEQTHVPERYRVLRVDGARDRVHIGIHDPLQNTAVVAEVAGDSGIWTIVIERI